MDHGRDAGDPAFGFDPLHALLKKALPTPGSDYGLPIRLRNSGILLHRLLQPVLPEVEIIAVLRGTQTRRSYCRRADQVPLPENRSGPARTSAKVCDISVR